MNDYYLNISLKKSFNATKRKKCYLLVPGASVDHVHILLKVLNQPVGDKE